MKKLIVSCLLVILTTGLVEAQFAACSCSASAGAGSVNFSSLSWTGTGCPTAGSTSYTGTDLCLSLANGTNLIFDKSNFTINGDFNITNNGNSTFTLPANDNLHVTGNMGDQTNNNVTFTIDGNLTVDKTLYGKNSNAFSGTGSFTGSLNFNMAPTGGTGITWSVPPGGCQPSASSFCTTTVPITLSSFSASAGNENVQLKWSTSSELNFNFFSLQRSADGKSFQEIAQVKGHGTTNDPHTYSFDDTYPLIGRSYYRLISNDFDGYQQTFEVVSVVYNGEKKFQISPNPSDGSNITLTFNFENDADAIVAVYDNLGSLVGSYKISGSGTVTLESTLKSGVYLAKYTSSSLTKTERFLVK